MAFDVEIDITETANDVSVEAGAVTPFTYLDTLYLKRVGPDWAGFLHKAAAVLTDQFLIEDSEAGGAKKYTTVGDLPLLKRASNDFTTFTQKNSPVVTDTLLLEDSAAGGAKKYAQLGNLPMLKRIANDFTTFARKNPVSVNDKLIIEDYDNAGVKKYIYVGDLPFGAGGAGLSTMMIGGLMTGGTDKSVLFVDGIALGQDPTYFSYNKASQRVNIGSNQAPWTTNGYLVIGDPSVDHVLPSLNWSGIDLDSSFTTAFNNGWINSAYVNLQVGGTGTGSSVVGYSSNVSLRSAGGVSLGRSAQLLGYYAFVNGESPADEMHGIWVLSGTGSSAAQTTNLMVGGTFHAGPHNTTGGNAYGVDGILYEASGGDVTGVDVGAGVRARVWARSTPNAFPDIRGVSISDWSFAVGSSVTNSYALYIDSTVDYGTNKWAIYSLSTSPSLLTGELRVPNDVYGAGWNGNLAVPTKDAVYDKIESIIAGGAIAIGGAVGGGGLAESVLYVGAGATIAQDNDKFAWQDASSRLAIDSKFSRIDYLGTKKVNLLIEPDDVQYSFLHNPGAVDWSAIYIEQDNSTVGNNLNTRGLELYTNFSGSGTGHNVYGVWNQSLAVFHSVAPNVVVGGNFTSGVQAGPAPTTAIRGLDVNAGTRTGVTGTVPLISGVRSTISQSSSVITDAAMFRGEYSRVAGTITDLKGLELKNWAAGAATNSYGVYIDSTIDVGLTTKWAIYSLSTSPSLFSGEVRVPADPYGVGWNGSLAVPTKDAVYDKVSVLEAALEVSLNKDYSNNFATAIAAIGGANVTLKVDAAVTVAADITVPQNIQLKITGAGVITVNPTFTLTVGAMIDPGTRQVFAGTGNVRFTKGAVSMYNTAWWTGPVSGGTIDKALTDIFASCTTNLGGHVYIPDGLWLCSGNQNIPLGVTVEGSSRRGVAGSGTEVRLTLNNRPLFQLQPNNYEVRLRNMTLNGNNLANTQGFLAVGTGGVDPIVSGLFFEGVTVMQFTDGIYLHGISDWQIRQVYIDRECVLANCTSSCLRINTINSNVWCAADIFIINGAHGIWVESVGGLYVTNTEFAFNGAPGYGSQQIIQQIVAGNVTVAGVAKSVITSAGTPGSPITVNVPVTTADNTAGKIADKFRKALAKNATVAKYFYVMGVNGDSTIQLGKIDEAANDATFNFTIETGTATGITNSLASTNVNSGVVQTAIAESAINITGAYGFIGLYNTQDEGIKHTVKHNFVNSSNGHLVLQGCLIQGRISMLQAGRLTCVGCIGVPKLVRDADAGSLSIIELVNCSAGFQPFIGGAFRASEQRFHNISDITGTNKSVVSETVANNAYDLPQSNFETRHRFIQPQTAWSADPTEAWVSIFCNNILTDQVLLRLGRTDASGYGDFYYDFYRESATGKLVINGNQADPFKGVKMNSPVEPVAVLMSERTAPAAPAANEVIIYAQDNGAGKTQLMALFSSGAAQQIAIQP